MAGSVFYCLVHYSRLFYQILSFICSLQLIGIFAYSIYVLFNCIPAVISFQDDTTMSMPEALLHSWQASPHLARLEVGAANEFGLLDVLNRGLSKQVFACRSNRARTALLHGQARQAFRGKALLKTKRALYSALAVNCLRMI